MRNTSCPKLKKFVTCKQYGIIDAKNATTKDVDDCRQTQSEQGLLYTEYYDLCNVKRKISPCGLVDEDPKCDVRCKHKDSLKCKLYRYSMFLNGYRTSTFYWECIIATRKSLITFIGVFFFCIRHRCPVVHRLDRIVWVHNVPCIRTALCRHNSEYSRNNGFDGLIFDAVFRADVLPRMVEGGLAKNRAQYVDCNFKRHFHVLRSEDDI